MSEVTIIGIDLAKHVSLADHLVGDEVRRVQAAIAAIRNAAQGSIVRNRALESGKSRPLDRLKLALNKKDAT